MKQMATARRQRHWDLRAAGNFIGGGTGTGLIIASALAAMGGAIPPALAAGVVFVMLGLSMVWLEIGKPWRALHVFFHPQTSWMTREGIVAGPLVLAGAAATLTAEPIAAVIAAALALVFLYCQARILRAARAIPAWRQPEIVALIMATGLAEGSGLLLVVGAQSKAALVVALAAGVWREVAWWTYRGGLTRTGAPAQSLEVLSGKVARAAHTARLTGIALMALSLAGGGATAAVVGGLLAAIAGWTLKALLVTRAAFTRGAAIPYAPARGRGVSQAVLPNSVP